MTIDDSDDRSDHVLLLIKENKPWNWYSSKWRSDRKMILILLQWRMTEVLLQIAWKM